VVVVLTSALKAWHTERTPTGATRGMWSGFVDIETTGAGAGPIASNLRYVAM
jgi:hypothetical protein